MLVDRFASGWSRSSEVGGDDADGAVGPHRVKAFLISRDAALAEHVERLAREVDVVVETVPSWPRQLTRAAGLVLVGADVAAGIAAAAETSGVTGGPSGGPAGGGARLVVAAGAPPAGLWHAAVALGADQVVVLPEAETWLASRLLAAGGGERRRARVVGVAGGRGGAGASVLAAALARTAAALGHRPVLIDADPLGGGSDLLLGAEDEPGLRWPDLAAARGRLQPDQLLDGLPVIDGVPVVSWDRRDPEQVPPAAMRAVLEAATRVADVVIADLPRALDPTATAAVEACDCALLVVPAEVRASVSARRSAAALRRWVADVHLVVRGPAPTGLAASSVARALDLPLAGWLPAERGLAGALDRGEPPALRPRGPLAVLCRQLLATNGPAAPPAAAWDPAPHARRSVRARSRS